MRLTFKLLIFTFLALSFSACSGDDVIDYRETIVGTWELKNTGELQRYLDDDDRPFILNNATMIFDDDGNLTTRLKRLNRKSWIEEKATWEMPAEGEIITIKSEKGPFDDKLEIDFPDERTFYIKSNRLLYHFIKL